MSNIFVMKITEAEFSLLNINHVRKYSISLDRSTGHGSIQNFILWLRNLGETDRICDPEWRSSIKVIQTGVKLYSLGLHHHTNFQRNWSLNVWMQGKCMLSVSFVLGCFFCLLVFVWGFCFFLLSFFLVFRGGRGGGGGLVDFFFSQVT